MSVTTITNRFVDGLKKEIKSVVMMHRPQDLDSMSSLALLQEEALLDPTNSSRRSEATSSFKKSPPDNVKGNVYSTSYSPRYSPSPRMTKGVLSLARVNLVKTDSQLSNLIGRLNGYVSSVVRNGALGTNAKTFLCTPWKRSRNSC